MPILRSLGYLCWKWAFEKFVWPPILQVFFVRNLNHLAVSILKPAWFEQGNFRKLSDRSHIFGALRIHLPLWKHLLPSQCHQKGASKRGGNLTPKTTSQGFLGWVTNWGPWKWSYKYYSKWQLYTIFWGFLWSFLVSLVFHVYTPANYCNMSPEKKPVQREAVWSEHVTTNPHFFQGKHQTNINWATKKTRPLLSMKSWLVNDGIQK